MTLAEMQFVPPDLRLAGAEIFMLAMAAVVLLSEVFVKSKTRTATFVLTLLALFGAAALTVALHSGEKFYTFSNMFVADPLADFLKLGVYLAVLAMLLYSRAYVLDRPQMARGEFYALTLFATLGMMVMISGSHFLSIYIGVELLSLSLYAMVAMDRDSVPATEAAMKYFVLGALASGLLLYGISMIYGATGSLELAAVSKQLAVGQGDRIVAVFGLVFLVAGLAFKLGVVPFHMWIPDVYQGSPTAVTLFIASAPKLAGFAIMIRILVSGLLVTWADWQSMLLILAVLSMALGNFAAIAQTNLKRMLAYSAISHMGFMLLGMAVGVVGGDARMALNAYGAALFYSVTYVLTSAGAFGMILLLARNGLESDEIKDFAGLNKRNPWFAGLMMMMMFSMAGIPFFVGFFAKFAILQSVVAAGYIGLALAAVFFSLVGAYYYLRLVKVMYFDPPPENAAPVAAGLDVKLLLSANGIAVAALGLLPQKLMVLCVIVLSRSL